MSVPPIDVPWHSTSTDIAKVKPERGPLVTESMLVSDFSESVRVFSAISPGVSKRMPAIFRCPSCGRKQDSSPEHGAPGGCKFCDCTWIAYGNRLDVCGRAATPSKPADDGGSLEFRVWARSEPHNPEPITVIAPEGAGAAVKDWLANISSVVRVERKCTSRSNPAQ